MDVCCVHWWVIVRSQCTGGREGRGCCEGGVMWMGVAAEKRKASENSTKNSTLLSATPYEPILWWGLGNAVRTKRHKKK